MLVTTWYFTGLKFIPIHKLYFKFFVVLSMFFNIFVYRLYNLKKFIIHLIITLFILGVSYHVKDYSISYLWFILLCTANVSFKSISKTVLTVCSIMVPTIILLTLTHHLYNFVFVRDFGIFKLYRYSLGFTDPNVFAGMLLQICMAFTYIRWDKFKKFDYAFLFTIFVFVLLFTNSRTSAILILALMILIDLFKKISPNKLKIVSYGAFAGSPILSLIMAKLYGAGVKIVILADEMISYRFRNLCYSLAKNPISLFGKRYNITNDMDIVGNMWGRIYLDYGIFFFMLVLYGFGMTIKKALEHKDRALLVLLIITILQAICEIYPLILKLNYTILAFSVLINNEKMFDLKPVG